MYAIVLCPSNIRTEKAGAGRGKLGKPFEHSKKSGVRENPIFRDAGGWGTKPEESRVSENRASINNEVTLCFSHST